MSDQEPIEPFLVANDTDGVPGQPPSKFGDWVSYVEGAEPDNEALIHPWLHPQDKSMPFGAAKDLTFWRDEINAAGRNYLTAHPYTAVHHLNDHTVREECTRYTNHPYFDIITPSSDIPYAADAVITLKQMGYNVSEGQTLTLHNIINGYHPSQTRSDRDVVNDCARALTVLSWELHSGTTHDNRERFLQDVAVFQKEGTLSDLSFGSQQTPTYAALFCIADALAQACGIEPKDPQAHAIAMGHVKALTEQRRLANSIT